MRLMHIADLHLGKRVNEFSMIEDQQYILKQILEIAGQEEPDCILIAGDVYDKSVPSAEAVELLDGFLTELLAMKRPVFLISGNHDSPERLGFGSRIMENDGLYISGPFDGTMRKETLTDEFGEIDLYLLPFLKPIMVKPFFEEPAESYSEAVDLVIAGAGVGAEGAGSKKRRVLLAHQFVTSGAGSPERSDSENISIGGLDNVDSSSFDAFDYVALGHLHGPQRIGRDTIRYAGSPLKYSFSEARQHKSVTFAELKEKGNVEIKLVPLRPARDLREIRGPIVELLALGRQNGADEGDYLHVTLTDEEELYDAVGQLRQVYPNLMCLDFDNSRTRQSEGSKLTEPEDAVRKTPVELFNEFYQLQNNNELDEKQLFIMERMFEQAGGGAI